MAETGRTGIFDEIIIDDLVYRPNELLKGKHMSEEKEIKECEFLTPTNDKSKVCDLSEDWCNNYLNHDNCPIKRCYYQEMKNDLLQTEFEKVNNQLTQSQHDLKVAKEYAQKALNHLEKDCDVAAKLVLRKIIKGEELGIVTLAEINKHEIIRAINDEMGFPEIEKGEG